MTRSSGIEPADRAATLLKTVKDLRENEKGKLEVVEKRDTMSRKRKLTDTGPDLRKLSQ